MAALEDNLRKVPPQNLEAESSVLGGIMLENEAVNQVLELLRPAGGWPSFANTARFASWPRRTSFG